MGEQDIRRSTRSGPTVVRLPKGGPAAAAAGGIRVARMRVVNGNDYGDYMICAPLFRVAGSADGQAAQVKVAKVFEARRTPFDGRTRSLVEYEYFSNKRRKAVRDATQDWEEVRVGYVPRDVGQAGEDYDGDEIFAVTGVEGGTGVVAETGVLGQARITTRIGDSRAVMQLFSYPAIPANGTEVEVRWMTGYDWHRRTRMVSGWSENGATVTVTLGIGEALPAQGSYVAVAILEDVVWQETGSREFVEVAQ